MYNDKKRKHRKQMSEGEVVAVKNRVNQVINSLVISNHAKDRMQEKGVTGEDLQRLFQNPKIVEVHNCVANDVRVLLRRDFERYAICAVISLTKGEVVTTYKNGKGDNHRTLNLNLYQWKVNLTGEV